MLALAATAAAVGCAEAGGGSGPAAAGGRTDASLYEDPVLARPGHPVASPSGRFILETVPTRSGGVRSEYFVIRRREGTVEFESRDLFAMRHTTFFLWDGRRDWVWVYSGDLGTFIWKRQGATSRWVKRHWGQERPPRFLVRARPDKFSP